MIAAVAIGAMVGALLFALLWTLIPRRTSALVQLGRFDARVAAGRRSSAPVAGTVLADGSGLARLQAWLGGVLGGRLAQAGIIQTSLRQDLALTGRTYEAMMGRKAIAFAAGFVTAGLGQGLLGAQAGLRVAPSAAVLVALGAGAGLFVLPDLEARREAAGARRDFRAALGSFLDLVALEMAGSAAPAEALPSAARIGAGWPMALLRDTLYRASLSKQDYWEALADLGARIGVQELGDLAALTRLVGRDGARVRETLTARAATLRRAQLAEAEGRAGQRDQSMLVAQVLIGCGFMAFLFYPALVNVLLV